MHNKKIKRLISLILVIALLLSAGITTAYADNATGQNKVLTSDKYHYTLDEIVELFGDALDGDEMLRYAAFVYKGWRTSYGNWLNEIMVDIKGKLEDVGYQDGREQRQATRATASGSRTRAPAAMHGTHSTYRFRSRKICASLPVY